MQRKTKYFVSYKTDEGLRVRAVLAVNEHEAKTKARRRSENGPWTNPRDFQITTRYRAGKIAENTQYPPNSCPPVDDQGKHCYTVDLDPSLGEETRLKAEVEIKTAIVEHFRLQDEGQHEQAGEVFKAIRAERFFWRRKTMRIQNVFKSGEDIHVTVYAQVGGPLSPFKGYTTVLLSDLPRWYRIPKLDTEEQGYEYFESLFEEPEPEVDWVNGEEARIAAAESAQWTRDNDPDERYHDLQRFQTIGGG